MCMGTGALNISFEICAYLHIIAFTIILKNLVSKPTKSHTKLQVFLHFFSVLFSLIFVIIVSNTFEFGLSVIFIDINFPQITLTCSIAMNSGTKFDDLLRLWPVILIPFSIYNMIMLVRNVPKLIKSNVISSLVTSLIGDFFHILICYAGPFPSNLRPFQSSNHPGFHLCGAQQNTNPL